MSDDGRIVRIREILEETKPKPKPRRSAPAKPVHPGTAISGIGNVVGDGNTVHNHITVQPPVSKTKVIVKTGVGTINAEQKRVLHDLVGEIVSIEKVLKRAPRTFQAVWSAFNKRYRINSYHELGEERFADAEKYLRTEIGRLRSMKSAPGKLGDQRAARIKAIQARSREFPGGTERRKAYMVREFGLSSLTDASDDQVEQIYRHVFGW